MCDAYIGLAHVAREDDVHEGYFIPKGTIVVANVWEMNRDPEIPGADVHTFNPERYLDEKGEALQGLPRSKEDDHHTFSRFVQQPSSSLN